MAGRVILTDEWAYDRRAAVLDQGRLIAFFNDNAFDDTPRPGAVVAVRVARVFLIVTGSVLIWTGYPPASGWGGGRPRHRGR